MNKNKNYLTILAFGLTILTTLIFGIWGFSLLEEKPFFLSLLYETIQLFTLESGAVEGPIPWQLELARWLATLTLLGGVFELLKTIFSEKYNAWRIKKQKGHHIIVGLNENSLHLANDILTSGQKVVIIAEEGSNPLEREKLRDTNGLFLQKSIHTQTDLRTIGIAKARTFTTITSNDALNLALSGAAKGQALETNNTQLHIHVHLENPTFKETLSRSFHSKKRQDNLIEIRSFTSYSLMARRLMRDFPLETAGYADGATNTERKIHLVLRGLQNAEIALITHTARIAHYLGGRKVNIHIVSQNAISEIAEMRSEFPGIDRCCNLYPIQSDTRKDDSINISKLLNENKQDCFTIFPCFDYQDKHLPTILDIIENSSSITPLRIMIPIGLRECFGPLLGHEDERLTAVSWFPDTQKCFDQELIFREKLDELAIISHQNWYECELERMKNANNSENLKNKPAHRPWAELNENLKESNRSLADHAPIKIRAAGLSISEVDSDQWDSWIKANPTAFEEISSAEHQRWCANLYLDGWTYAPNRNDRLKHHNNLLPYNSLDEDEKKHDRNMVLSVSKYLQIHS